MEQLCKQRRVVKGKLTRLSSFSLAELDNQSGDAELYAVRLEALDECQREFSVIQSGIDLLIIDDEDYDAQADIRADFEEKFFNTKANLRRLAARSSPTAPASVNGSNTSSQGVTSSQANVKLPRIDLPTFTGDYKEWTAFRDLFTSLIDENGALSPVQRLHYLKASLKGDAKRLLSSMTSTHQNYAEAWTILTNRYDNRRVIINAHLDALFKVQALKVESAPDMRKLVDSFVENIRALHVLGEPVDQWDSMLVYNLTQKLDNKTRRHWELANDTSNYPKFKELCRFLENRCLALEATGGKAAAFSANPHNSTQSSKSKVQTYFVSAKSHCFICMVEHSTYSCPRLLELSPVERLALIKSKSLCTNCFHPSHGAAKACKFGHCHTCRGKHHTLLHIDSPASSPEVKSLHMGAATSFHQREGSQVLLATARLGITASDGKIYPCRALVDPGSQSCFIRSSLARFLGLRYNESLTTVNGIGATTSTSTSWVSASILSRDEHSQLRIEANVLDRISGDLPSVPFCTNQWEHLNSLHLADDRYYTPDNIDLLLGADVFAEIILNGKIQSVDGSPVALNSKLGWLLLGRLSSGRSPTRVAAHFAGLSWTLPATQSCALENVPLSTSIEGTQCESHFAANRDLNASRRYGVQLPINGDIKSLPSSWQIAASPFQSVDPLRVGGQPFSLEYHDHMDSNVSLGHTSLAPPLDSEPTVGQSLHLPHYSVRVEASDKTPLRVLIRDSSVLSKVAPPHNHHLSRRKFRDNLTSSRPPVALMANTTKCNRQLLVIRKQLGVSRLSRHEPPQVRLKTRYPNHTTQGNTATSSLSNQSHRRRSKPASRLLQLAGSASHYISDLRQITLVLKVCCVATHLVHLSCQHHNPVRRCGIIPLNHYGGFGRCHAVSIRQITDDPPDCPVRTFALTMCQLRGCLPTTFQRFSISTFKPSSWILQSPDGQDVPAFGLFCKVRALQVGRYV